MAAIVSLLIILVISILITRVASVTLTHTGLSRESARFQARSAFTGVGFTTLESEKVVNHPVRRRILLFLMLVGNVGIVTAVSSLILSFIDTEDSPLGTRMLLLISGLVVLLVVFKSSFIDRHLSNLISRILRRTTHLDVRDYASLLHLSGEYRVTDMRVEEDGWMAGHKLAELRLRDEGVMVLGVTRTDGTYIGAPAGTTLLLSGDTLILYGRSSCFEKLGKRRAGAGGDEEHDRAVADQQQEVRRQKAFDPGDDSRKLDGRGGSGDDRQ